MARPSPRPAAGPPRRPDPPPPPDHPLDAAVRHKDPARAPEGDRDAVRAVLAGFAAYSQGNDDAARESLNAVGVKSPLLDWKLLLRGLIAYSAADDDRALENWRRLSADRLPARLAAPLRLRLDPPFGATLGPTRATAARSQLLRLEADPVAQRFAELQSSLGRDQPLTKAFAAVERLLPLLKESRPDLVPRLAKVVYWAVQRFGEPGDVARHLRVLGRPPDDPDFHRLNAMNYERSSPADALGYWLKYEKWLGTGPAGVPAATARQARVWVLHHAGKIAAILAARDDGIPGFDDIFAQMFGGKRPKGLGDVKILRPTAPEPPTAFWARALALDPANEAVAVDLVEHHRDRDEPTEALAAADEFLTHAPDSLPVLHLAAALHLAARDPTGALPRLKHAHALNPLDAGTQAKLGLVYFGIVRQALAGGDAAEVRAKLDEARAFGGGQRTPAADHSVRAVLALKAKDAAGAKTHEDAALADPRGRLGATLMLAADATLAKLKPALRKPFDARLAEVFAAPLPPGTGVAAVAEMLGVASLYAVAGVAYRGQPTHVKKVHELLMKCVQADAESPAADFAHACHLLQVGEFAKVLEKFADALSRRFVTDPLFPLFAAEAVFDQAEASGRPPAYRKLDAYARKAERLSRGKAPELRRKVMERLEAIDATGHLGDEDF